MILINFRRMVLPALFLFLAVAVSAQSGAVPSSSPLGMEIGNIEKKLGLNTLSVNERREAYITLASLYMLSGNQDASARAWWEAAFADPANRDDRCLLKSSQCFLALGEFDAALDALQGILGSQDPALVRAARYIGAQVDVFRTGHPASLYALLGNAEFQEYRPAIYYTFWRLFADGSYKTQILSEFPNSPEALILKNEESLADDGNRRSIAAVSALPRPLWIFYPGRGNVAIGAAIPTPGYAAPPAAASLPAASAPATASASGGPQAGPTALQTGLFTREENTRDMVARLAARGFTASVSQKLVNSVTYWVVTIPPGENSNQTILRLKDAGFESFPVF
jgi:hypothetical protein